MLEKGDRVTIRYRAPLFFDQAGDRIGKRDERGDDGQTST